MKLRFHDVAPGRFFHAALVTMPLSRQERRTSLHTHDFWEMMYVLRGQGVHQIGGIRQELKAGELLLVRPHDCHSLEARAGDNCRFINVAFPAREWHDFARATHLEEELNGWAQAAQAPTCLLPYAERSGCKEAFEHVLRAYHEQSSPFALPLFWSQTLQFLLHHGALQKPSPPQSSTRLGAEPAPIEPLWLKKACAAMAAGEQAGEHLRAGVPRLVQLAGVSAAHLARSMQTHHGQTPTAWVNALRLKRAATLLATTSLPIAEVAAECGFENLSYFYRQFAAAEGTTPRDFRSQAQRSIAP